MTEVGVSGRQLRIGKKKEKEDALSNFLASIPLRINYGGTDDGPPRLYCKILFLWKSIETAARKMKEILGTFKKKEELFSENLDPPQG